MAKYHVKGDQQMTGSRWREAGPDLILAETYWGYIIRTSQRAPMGLKLGQAVAGMAGFGCMALAGSLWIVPGASFDGEVMLMKLMGSALLLMLGALLLWFANRGTDVEWHVDTTRGEIREVLQNRAGRPSLLSSYGFDAFGGVVIDRVSLRGKLPSGHACLVLRLGNSAQYLPLAMASEDILAPLRDRLGRDMIMDQRAANPGTSALRMPSAQAA